MAIDSQQIPAYTKIFCASGAGIAAALACHPMEVLKLHMQVDGAGGTVREHATMVQTVRYLWRRGGIRSIYSGLSASVFRQAKYTGVRLGLFQVIIDNFAADDHPPGLVVKLGASVVAGALGGIIGLPPDVALTRMVLDKRNPPEKKWGYGNVFQAMGRIHNEEGGRTLFTGLWPTIVRAIIVNTSQMLTYMQAKEFFLAKQIMEDDSQCHFVCSVMASIVATTTALPPDMAKTRLQQMRFIDGEPEYNNMLDVWAKVVQKEGPLALWKGFTPLLLRNGPQFIVLFMVYEQLIKSYKQAFLQS